MVDEVDGPVRENKDRLLSERWMEPVPEAVLRDRPIEWLQSIRFWGSIMIGAVVKAPLVLNDRVRLSLWAVDGVLRLLLAPVALAVTASVIVAVYLTAVRRQLGGRLAVRLRGPLTALGAFLGHILLIAAIWGAAAWFYFGPIGRSPASSVAAGVAMLALALGLVYATARGVGFLLHAIPAISRYMFRTMEIHQALPALITIAFAWELALQDIFFSLAQWPQIPPMLPLGGATATSLIALLEIHRLRTRHGIRLRVLPRLTLAT
ncbi:hypothetical protein [Streptomyces atratus]|uniref:Uncharacterized protein n=1 Tax=Streptomyces atratus TaxID=1893 RepID=A0A2Z5JPZ6_STRAR|nr:hypothetical protein [Streptomyces atratus]AXE82284.1 hypothetical protein C5746_41680 [Streptomyces atratus]